MTDTTHLLLTDGRWYDVSLVRWPRFHGQPGYAARMPAGRWLIGPTSALQPAWLRTRHRRPGPSGRRHRRGLMADRQAEQAARCCRDRERRGVRTMSQTALCHPLARWFCSAFRVPALRLWSGHADES